MHCRPMYCITIKPTYTLSLNTGVSIEGFFKNMKKQKLLFLKDKNYKLKVFALRICKNKYGTNFPHISYHQYSQIIFSITILLYNQSSLAGLHIFTTCQCTEGKYHVIKVWLRHDAHHTSEAVLFSIFCTRWMDFWRSMVVV